jgi:hypothetical protein
VGVGGWTQYTLWEVKRVHVGARFDHGEGDRVELWAFQAKDSGALGPDPSGSRGTPDASGCVVKRSKEQRRRAPVPDVSTLLSERGARVGECSNGDLRADVSHSRLPPQTQTRTTKVSGATVCTVAYAIQPEFSFTYSQGKTQTLAAAYVLPLLPTTVRASQMGVVGLRECGFCPPRSSLLALKRGRVRGRAQDVEMLNWAMEGCQGTRNKECCRGRDKLPRLSVVRLRQALHNMQVLKNELEVRRSGSKLLRKPRLHTRERERGPGWTRAGGGNALACKPPPMRPGDAKC